ncbi:hypothetical protein IFM89_030816 [Coptis chinensis]|uniref:Uncharacterized protein n=1 Tax=Coptis chinensis TaxID=261450 RepID=A0A835LT01_9MAGN|nr:hypothetical protein IFM89_030816 [Coptis chinensis]
MVCLFLLDRYRHGTVLYFQILLVSFCKDISYMSGI